MLNGDGWSDVVEVTPQTSNWSDENDKIQLSRCLTVLDGCPNTGGLRIIIGVPGGLQGGPERDLARSAEKRFGVIGIVCICRVPVRLLEIIQVRYDSS